MFVAVTMKLMVLEWWGEADGGSWAVIGFFDTVEQVRAILPSRPPKAARMILSVQQVSLDGEQHGA